MPALDSDLRPLERAVLRHADAGMPTSEIAWRFRRSPRHIQRVIDLSQVPRTPVAVGAADASGLRPIERCVVKARRSGSDYPEIAARLRRSPEHVARVEELANYKLRGQGGTSS